MKVLFCKTFNMCLNVSSINLAVQSLVLGGITYNLYNFGFLVTCNKQQQLQDRQQEETVQKETLHHSFTRTEGTETKIGKIGLVGTQFSSKLSEN